jgi:hypothetical protein
VVAEEEEGLSTMCMHTLDSEEEEEEEDEEEERGGGGGKWSVKFKGTARELTAVINDNKSDDCGTH